MPASLSPAQVEQYRRDGFLYPVDCLTPAEVAYFRGRLEDFEHAQGDTFGKLPDLVRSKSHLLFTWMDALVRHPKVLDAVESIIGPDILIYHLTSWLKEPGEPSHVLASGRYLFRPGAGGADHCLDRAHGCHAGNGLHQDHPRQPCHRPAPAPGYRDTR